MGEQYSSHCTGRFLLHCISINFCLAPSFSGVLRAPSSLGTYKNNSILALFVRKLLESHHSRIIYSFAHFVVHLIVAFADQASMPELAPAMVEPQSSNNGQDIKDVQGDQHHRKVMFMCLLILVPMLLFTSVLLWLIFGHTIDRTPCPYPQLCPVDQQLDRSPSTSDYIVDFPAAQLVFVASWSSTISLSLVGLIMALYAHIAAHQWLQLSNGQGKDGLPTPYQTSLMLRILNAELLPLLDIGWKAIKIHSWRSSKSAFKKPRTPLLLRMTTAIFVFGLGLRQVV